MRLLAALLIIICMPCMAMSYAEDMPANPTQGISNLYAEQFYLKAGPRIQQQTYLINGFAFLETPNREKNTRYSIVTQFSGPMVKSRYLPGLQAVPDIKKWLKENVETAEYEGVQIKKLTLGQASENPETFYWVGQKAFPSLETAKQEIATLKSVVEAQGGDLRMMVREALSAIQLPEEAPSVEIAKKADFQKQEEIILRMLDKMEFGEKLFGPFEGETSGEPIVWRSFGETAWRKTALESNGYKSQVGYWTNQLIFQGIKFPLNTINPFVEVTTDLDATGIDYKSKMLAGFGLEWRPDARNAWLENFRPWGIPLLKWMRNFRTYVYYGKRFNIKDEISGSPDHDLQVGVDNFYEWGVDLPPIDQGAPTTVADYLEKYTWGEYYGKYHYAQTGFSDPQYQNFTFNSSVIFGLKTPGLPLPSNWLVEEIVGMPYIRFEHVNNEGCSAFYLNRFFVAAGLRWMPFRSYRFKDNEWLSKIKVFGEYVGIGDVQYSKKEFDEVPYGIHHDWIIGVKFSQKRA